MSVILPPGIVVLGINRPQAKNAISKGLVKSVSYYDLASFFTLENAITHLFIFIHTI